MFSVRKILVLLFAFSATSIMADTKSQDQDLNCIVMSAEPSFIVPKDPASKKRGLATANELSLTGLDLISIKPTSGDAEVFSFSSASERGKKRALDKSVKKLKCYPKEQVEQWISQIKQKKGVKKVIPDVAFFLSSTEKSDPLPQINSDYQWNLLTFPGSNIQDAWAETQGLNAIVAVLDSGYMPNTALEPNVINHRITFNNQGTIRKLSNYPSCIPKEDEVACGHDHGNHVSGIIAAPGVFAHGGKIYGVAPKSKILLINVFTKIDDPQSCKVIPGKKYYPCITAFSQDIRNALIWIKDSDDIFFKTNEGERIPNAPKGIVAVNMSLGGKIPCYLDDLIPDLHAKNITVVTAAGNDKENVKDYAPGNCPGVINVAATDSFGNRATYSNYGDNIAIAAPGGDEAKLGLKGIVFSVGEKLYSYKQGTSMAAPHVSGLVALLYSVSPTLTPKEALAIIQKTANPFPFAEVPDFNCKAPKSCGVGIINVAAAVQEAKSQAPKLSWNLSSARVTKTGTLKADIKWDSAGWLPERSTPIVYTVNINGNDITGCINQKETSCPINIHRENVRLNVVIKATDYRNLSKPLETQPVTIDF